MIVLWSDGFGGWRSGEFLRWVPAEEAPDVVGRLVEVRASNGVVWVDGQSLCPYALRDLLRAEEEGA